LLKLQTELLQALDRHRRGHHQTVEVHHVHLYPGSQSVIGVVNPTQDGARTENDGRPPCTQRLTPLHCTPLPDAEQELEAASLAARLRSMEGPDVGCTVEQRAPGVRPANATEITAPAATRRKIWRQHSQYEDCCEMQRTSRRLFEAGSERWPSGKSHGAISRVVRSRLRSDD